MPAIAATGAIAKKMLRQPNSSSSQPPTIGPSAIATPVIAPQRPIASARSRRSMNTFVISDSVEGNTIAAPTPITARAPISWPGLPVSPPAMEAIPNTDRPASSIPLRPNRSDRLPAARTEAANTRLKASTTHCSCELDVCTSRTSVGSATLMIVVSTLITNAASNSETRISGLRPMALLCGLACITQGRLRVTLAFVKQVSYYPTMLQRDYPDQVCSIARSLEVIGERWTLLILRDAILGVERFEDFQETLGIASNVLTNRLKLLSDEGILERLPDPQRPGRPRYVLTDKGRELAPALIVLMKWGDRHYPTPAGPPRLTVHAGCGGNVGADFRCERCGRHLGRDEIELPPGPGAPRAERAGR